MSLSHSYLLYVLPNTSKGGNTLRIYTGVYLQVVSTRMSSTLSAKPPQ